MTVAARKLMAPSCAKLCPDGQTSISLCDGFRLTADAHCWILQQRKGLRKSRRGHKTEVMWRPISYHPSIESALKHFGELRLRLSGAQSFDELLREQKATRELIERVLSACLAV